MKISVVVTVLNEEASISELIDSLLHQSRKPDEIVIVDGGSTDQTPIIVKTYQINDKKIRLFIEKSNIASGRNLAIKRAKYPIVTQIDGGCIAHNDWLEKITAPFKDKDVGLSAGFYQMIGTTDFQSAIAPFHGVCARRFDMRTFMPSGRSMAFRKSVWEKVGGYSESLENAGEDTLFNYKVLKNKIKIVRVPDALVDWELPNTLSESCKKLFYYAKGDAQSGIWWHPAQRLATHNIKIISVFLRYILIIFLFLAGLDTPILMYLLIILINFYLFWKIFKLEDVVHQPKAKLWLPIIQVSADLCVMAGFVSGMLQRR